jgi:hypothetical protein
MIRTIFSAVLAVFVTCGCVNAQDKPVPLVKTPDGSELAARFAQHYAAMNYQVTPSVPEYQLPLQDKDLYNLDKISMQLGPDAARQLLLKNGFVTTTWGADDEVVAAYKSLKEMGVPIFVTSDSLLHLYHIQFDETLKTIEQKEFYPDLIKISEAMQAEFMDRYKSAPKEVKPAYLKGLAYFSVGLKLLKPDAPVPATASSYVNWELNKIEKHEGMSDAKEAEKNAIFACSEDYSQYVPRGHYTQTEELKRYFKAMMWYGRMTMLIKGNVKYGPDDEALVSPSEAKTQTILAATIASLAGSLKIDGAPLIDKWYRIYAVSAYYVGFSDDLSIYEYEGSLKSVFGDNFKPSQLAADDAYLKFASRIAALRKPEIYSGTGASGIDLDKEGTLKPEQLQKILGKTQGFRFMGQRYVPDSFILGQLVAPNVDKVTGDPGVFTAVPVPDYGVVRMFPRGLDVMAVLGSPRAAQVLENIGDSKFVNYKESFDKVKSKFDGVSEKDWNRNLYWSWLYALKSLVSEPAAKGWPTFMQTDAWKDKELNAALGSWAALRHDTILYVKQSYTPGIAPTAAEPMPRELPVVGYIEPVPEFYARLIALTRMTEKGLGDLKVLDPESKNRLESLDEVLSRLLAISTRELENQKLAQEDYDFIANFAANINSIVTGSGNATQKTSLVADVHTVQNTNQALEEATGYLRLMWVAYKMPEGHIVVGAGPVYSYYEFKQPISDRLTDEKWRDMLTSGKAPALPEWTKSFASF